MMIQQALNSQLIAQIFRILKLNLVVVDNLPRKVLLVAKIICHPNLRASIAIEVNKILSNPYIHVIILKVLKGVILLRKEEERAFLMLLVIRDLNIALKHLSIKNYSNKNNKKLKIVKNKLRQVLLKVKPHLKSHKNKQQNHQTLRRYINYCKLMITMKIMSLRPPLMKKFHLISLKLIDRQLQRWVQFQRKQMVEQIPLRKRNLKKMSLVSVGIVKRVVEVELFHKRVSFLLSLMFLLLQKMIYVNLLLGILNNSRMVLKVVALRDQNKL